MSLQPHTIHTLSEAPIELSGATIKPLMGEPVKIEHKALMDNSLRNHTSEWQSTIATLRETPFKEDNGDNLEHNNIVATVYFL